jgi:RNA polymerase sigma-70 factor, ECF subfamily
MTTSPSVDLVAAFVAGGGPVPAQRASLAKALDAAFDRAQARWPGVSLPAPELARALGQRAPSDGDLLEWLGGANVEDVYLACACVRGDAAALAALDRDLLDRLRGELARTPTLGQFADEARQQLRVRLLVAGSDGSEPRLAGYKGHGPLVAWLRLTLTRLALNLLESDARQAQLKDELARAPGDSDDPELAFLRRKYRPELTAAMTEALEGLASEERAILRMHFLDGVSVHDIGRMFQVSGRTIQRRIVDTRRAIVARTREALRAKLGIGASQLATLMRLVDGELELSLHRILAPPDLDG